ncbi:MAG: cysteine desulfurase [Verrucomicrobia bacterium]|nr:cysteine desulfurase [Verrucomicrobiota bacterium]
MNRPIYLDYNATTPVDPRVAEEMWPFVEEQFGNPSSAHALGQTAKAAVEKARGEVAGLLGCQPDEVVFTSGGSESNNMAIKGVAYSLRAKGNHLITSQVEHPAVLNPLRFLERNGFRVTYLPVDRFAMVRVPDVEAAVTPQTILITIMHANNEVGTVEPIAAIGQIGRARGVLVHTDAAQSVGKIPTRVDDLNVDLLTVAGHKLYAPKGVGALYVRRGVKFEPLIHGAEHESGRRAGTENVPSIVALGKACALAGKELDERRARLTELRDHLHNDLQRLYSDHLHLNGHPSERLPNTLNVSFEGRIGSEVLDALGQVAASTGSACHAGTHLLSPVLKAMGVPERLSLGAVRFSLGQGTTDTEIDRVTKFFQEKVK